MFKVCKQLNFSLSWRCNYLRPIVTSSGLLGKLTAKFEEAQVQVTKLSEDPGNEAKLNLYALYKQATVGKVNVSRPGMMDFVGRAKWDAWNKLGTLSQEEAEQRYVDVVASLVAADAGAQDLTSSGGMETLLLENRDNMSVITFNRPDKKNAFSTKMYNEIIEALDTAGQSASAITVVTGAGDYYSSGNDLNNMMQIDPSRIHEASKEGGVLLGRFVSAFIDHPKPLVAVVNGPAIGVAVTTLGLFDVVYASDRATFETPFMSLGQSPEGCASYTFPKMMGHNKACEMMLFGKKFTSGEAKTASLVTEVFPDHSFQKEVWARLKEHASLPKNSLRFSKQLLRGADREALHAANERECELLVERWTSDECANAIMQFFAKKSKM